MNDKKQLVKYENRYYILMPVFYEHETRPAWRKYFIGTRAECENVFNLAPDFLTATDAENTQTRKNKIKEYLFYMDRGNVKKAAAIKKQYEL